MIKLYGYDEERDPDGQPVFFTIVDTWEDALTKVKEQHIAEKIPEFEVTEKLGKDEFLYARIKFD